MPCRSIGRRRRIGSSVSGATWGRSCSYREALHGQAARLQSLILSRVSFPRPLRAVRLVVVELDDEVAPAQIDFIAADSAVHLWDPQFPQCARLQATSDERLA